MLRVWYGETRSGGMFCEKTACWIAPAETGTCEGLTLLLPVDFSDIGDVDATEAGGVGIDGEPRFFAEEAAVLDLMGFAEAV